MGEIVPTAWSLQPGLLAIFVYGAAWIIFGMFFAGLDAKPEDKVAISMSITLKWASVFLTLGAFFLFFNAWGVHESEPAVATILAWIGVFVGVWAAIVFIFAVVGEKGGDFKPLAWLCLIAFFLDLPFLLTAPTALAWFPNFKRDFMVIVGIELPTLILFWLGIRFAPKLLRLAGALAIIIGAYCIFAFVRYILATMGMTAF